MQRSSEVKLELPEEAKKYFKYEEYGVVLQIKRALDLQIILVGK